MVSISRHELVYVQDVLQVVVISCLKTLIDATQHNKVTAPGSEVLDDILQSIFCQLGKTNFLAAYFPAPDLGS